MDFAPDFQYVARPAVSMYLLEVPRLLYTDYLTLLYYFILLYYFTLFTAYTDDLTLLLFATYLFTLYVRIIPEKFFSKGRSNRN